MFRQIIQFFKGVEEELRKVSWPSRNEAVHSTILVIALSLIAGFSIMAADNVLADGVDFLMEIDFDDDDSLSTPLSSSVSDTLSSFLQE